MNANKLISASESKSLSIPSSALAQRAAEMVKAESPEYLYNHCVRTYLFAQEIARVENMQFDPETAFIGCIMHDLGLVKKFHGKSRFEVDGADAAINFLTEIGADEQLKDVVWDAIALHTTLHIPLRKRPEIAFVHIGAGVDVHGIRIADIHPKSVKHILEEYPRKGLKANILDDFIAYLKDNPAGGTGYWVQQIAEKYIPGAPHYNFESSLNAAPFDE